MKIVHQCGEGCWKCFGSGEGRHDGPYRCPVCKGSGFIGIGEVEIEVDENEMDSPQYCEHCGMELIEELQNAEGEG